MSSQISVTINQAQLNRLTRTLRAVPGGLRRVIPPAINKTATQGRKRAARRINKASNIKVGDVVKRIKISPRASRAKWAATLRLSNDRLPLMVFSARQTMKGVTYRLGVGGRRLLRHAFIATMPSKHTGVFLRHGSRVKMKLGRYVGEYRQRIYEQKALSVAGVYEKGPAVASGIMREMGTLLQQNIDRRVRYVLMKA